MGNGVKSAVKLANNCAVKQFLLIYLCVPQCEQVERELYEMKWYLMSPTYRKQVAYLLRRWQMGCSIRIGPFEELNYETATNVSLHTIRFRIEIPTDRID